MIYFLMVWQALVFGGWADKIPWDREFMKVVQCVYFSFNWVGKCRVYIKGHAHSTYIALIGLD